MSFANKVVIITGASSGIGAATAKMFAKESAKLTLVGRNAERLKKTAEECHQASGEKPLEVVADISKDIDAKAIVKRTVDHFGKIDVLVNNAGIAEFTSIFSENFMATFDKVLNIDLRGTVVLTKEAAPYLVETRGNIVNVSSIAGISSSSTGSAYCAAKAGLDHFMRCLALELASKEVRVNTVNPGPVNTPAIFGEELSQEQIKILIDIGSKEVPLQRFSDPEEIGEVISFLASDKARSITGASYVVDNGCVLKGIDQGMAAMADINHETNFLAFHGFTERMPGPSCG